MSDRADNNRLRVLEATRLLDSSPERAFDRLTRLAAGLLRAPVALVSLVDDRRQFFKSAIGLEEPWVSRRETPLSHSFCQYAVRDRAPLVVNDAREHPFLRDNLAIRDLHVIAYAGIPLVVSGEAIGAFCVVDDKPREWSEDEVRLMTDLAASVESEIELRLALRSTHDQRALMEALLENIGDAVLAIDTNRMFLVANAAARRIFAEGAQPGRPLPPNWATLHRSTRPDGSPLPSEDGALGRALRGEKTEALEFTLKPIGASAVTWVEASGRPVHGMNGNIIAAVAVYRDVTTRRAELAELEGARLALERAEEQFRLLFETAPIGMTVLSVDGHFVRANERFYNLIGYDATALRMMTAEDLTHPDDRHEDGELMRALFSGALSHARRSKRYVHQNGHVVHVEVHGALLRNGAGAPIGFITQVVDVTAELAANALLRKSEALLSSVLQSVPDAIMSVDREGRVTAFNSRVVDDIFRTHGVKVDLGTRLFDIGDEQTRSAAIVNHRRCLLGEHLRFEWSFRDKNGGHHHLLMSHTPMVSAGEVFGATIVVTDITARKEMELAVQRKNGEIELLRSIATTANEALTSNEAIGHILELVAKFGKWALGHAFALVAGELISKNIWYMSNPSKLDRFRVESDKLIFRDPVTLPGQALAHKRAVWMESFHATNSFVRAQIAGEVGLQSGIAFPVFIGTEVVSVLEFFSERSEHSTPEFEELFENVGRQIGRVIERDRHAEAVRALSLTDELTGLYNRRGFLALVRQQLSVAARTSSGSALLSADLDGLKLINDEMGHAAGDEVIASFATVLRRTFRDADVVARLGGDEFVVWMSNSTGDTTTPLARLLQNIDSENASRPPYARLSASIGVLEVPPGASDPLEVLLARADALLYENKRAKRRPARA